MPDIMQVTPLMLIPLVAAHISPSPLPVPPQAVSSPMSAASPVKDLNMAQYLPSLRAAAVLRALKQLSEVYSRMAIPQLASLVPFMTFAEVEAVVVDAVKHEYLALRVDHRSGTLTFGGATLENDRVRGHLSLLARRLAKAAAMVEPGSATAAGGAAAVARGTALALARENMAKEHSRLLARKQASGL